MEKLKLSKKITAATVKAFAKRNSEKLYVKNESTFSGYSDMVEDIKNPVFLKTELTTKHLYQTSGIHGVYMVGQSRDSFKLYEDEVYIGISIWNCCGDCILTIKK